MTGSEWLDFMVSLTDSLAWPAAAIVALLILEPYLKELISLIETIRFKGLELNLNQSVDNTADKVASLETVDESIAEDPLPEVLDPDPRMAIIKSWASVETAVEDLASANKQVLGRVERISTRRRVEKLRRSGLIDDSLAAVLRDMGSVRNVVAHGGDISLHDATVREYARAASRLASIVEQQLETQSSVNQ